MGVWGVLDLEIIFFSETHNFWVSWKFCPRLGQYMLIILRKLHFDCFKDHLFLPWHMPVHKNTFKPICKWYFWKCVHFSSNFDQKFAKFDPNLTGGPSTDLQLLCDPNAKGIRVGGKNLVFWIGLWYLYHLKLVKIGCF